jgi:uncharacterized membrane protein YwzB
VNRSLLSRVLAVVALHSIVLGVVMLAAPFWMLANFGWEPAGTRFFPAQSGLFLLILGIVYAAAVRDHRLVWIVVLSKAMAVVFLVGEALGGSCPPVVYVTAAIDGLMGLAVALLWRASRR